MKIIKFKDIDKYKDFKVCCKGCEAKECNKKNAYYCPAFSKEYSNDITITVITVKDKK